MKRSSDGKVMNNKKVNFEPLNFVSRSDIGSNQDQLKMSRSSGEYFGKRATKKLVIHNLVNAKVDPEYLNSLLTLLESCVKSILNTGKSDQPYEKLYQAVSELYLFDKRAELFQSLKALIYDHSRNLIVNEILPKVKDKSFLCVLSNAWVIYCKKLELLVTIYLEVDRNRIGNMSPFSVWDTGLNTLVELIRYNSLYDPIEKLLLDNIESFRKGQSIEEHNFANVMKMLLQLKLHQEIQPRVRTVTSEFYSNDSKDKIRSLPLESYLEYVFRIIKKESSFFNSMCDWCELDVKKIVSNELITNHLDLILYGKDLESFFKDRKFFEIKQLFDLVCLAPDGVAKLNERFFDYVKSTGIEIVEKDNEIIQGLLDFKRDMDNIVGTSFEMKAPFTTSLQNAFKKIVNSKYNKVAELIAKYIDMKLRSGNKDFTESEFEQLLDKVMLFFRYNDAKDLFEGFYKKYLAKRLLFGKSASVDAEKTMLSKLKIECGQEFTAKLEGMFKDLEISNDLNENFARFLTNKGNADVAQLQENIDMTVHTLTTSNWPMEITFDFKIPAFMRSYEEVFTKFYQTKFQSKKLSWGRNLSHAILVFNSFSGGRKELQVSLFQASLLLLFNEVDELSLDDIRTRVFDKIPKSQEEFHENELRRALQSLACGKKDTRILLKTPKGKDVLDEDRFLFNKGFRNNLYRIKINQIQMKESKEEKEKVEHQVAIDRQSLIDATVVRIMKGKKTLTHNDLVLELFKILKFAISSADVKLRIDALIDRDFLRRDPADVKLYHYEA